MSIIIKLKGLPLEATSVDVRLYFLGLTIPDGGVHIVGGDEGIVFIEFSSDEDARQAMARGDGTIKNSNIKLLLSSRTEMQSVIDATHQQNQFIKQQHQKQHLQNHIQHQPSHNMGIGMIPMGPALLPNVSQVQPITNASVTTATTTPTTQHQAPIHFEGDPRMLSSNYQGMLNVINQQPQSLKNQQPQQQPLLPQNQHHHHQQQQQQQLQHQQLSQQQQTLQTQQSPFVDPRILSQNYLGVMPNLSQAQPLMPQASQIFNQFPPTTIATGNGNLGLSLLGNVGLNAAGVNLNPVVLGANTGAGVVGGNMGAPFNLGGNNNNNHNGNNNNNLNNASNNNNATSGNRNHSPDTRARMSGMRGGDDKLFANKRCVLAASNIPYRATSKDIIEFLSEFNIQEDCIRRRYNQKGQPTADAKIAFPTPDAAMKALKMMNKKTLCGRPVFLKPV